MEKQTQDFCIEIKTEKNLINDTENIDIINMICTMALETEGKNLDQSRVKESVKKLIDMPSYGHYVMIVDNIKKIFCGMNMVTYEYNFNFDKTILWLQSVFIAEDYRMKGLFRKLLAANENFVKGKENFKPIIKLYMEKNNYKAEQVYDKLGFINTNEVLYELDYDFDDISSLKNGQLNHLDLNENNLGYKIKVADQSFEKIISDNSNIKFISLVNSKNSEQDFFLIEKLASIKKVLNDDSLGKVIYVYDESQNSIAGLFFIFYEFSDWRNSIFWWVNDFIINEQYSEFFKINMKSIIYSLTKLNYEMKSCGLRFIVNLETENILENSILLKSHYKIYEKTIE
jgi:GNAT superfamily N-acetyltransferase